MKVKLFYAPEYNGANKDGYPSSPSRMPLISLPIIKSYAERLGHEIDQDDLDLKTYLDNRDGKKDTIDMSIFDDRERIAGFLEDKNDDELIEQAEKILKKTDYKGYDMLGFSTVHCWTFAPLGAIIVMSRLMKEETGSLMTVGGARFDQNIGKTAVQDIPDFDILCFNSNHFEFTRLLHGMDQDKIPKDLHSITVKNKRSFGRKDSKKPHDGFYDNKVLFPRPDFDGLPLDLYRFIPKRIKKEKISKKKALILPYYFVFGCPNQCVFCKDSYSDKLHLKDPYQVAEDLSYLKKRYHTSHFFFTNTSVNPTKEYGESVADALIESDVDTKWFDCATFNQMDRELLQKFYDSGARRLLFGMECASEKMQKYMQKNINLDKASNILKESNSLGIWNEIEMISGLPHETEKDTHESLEFMKHNSTNIDYFYLTKFYLTQSNLTKFPEKYGIKNIRDKKDDSHEGFAFDEIDGLSWKHKIRQKQHKFEQYERFRQTTYPNLNNSGQHSYPLAYLYSISDDKEWIKEIMKDMDGELI